jgi:hypothetical protein
MHDELVQSDAFSLADTIGRQAKALSVIFAEREELQVLRVELAP